LKRLYSCNSTVGVLLVSLSSLQIQLSMFTWLFMPINVGNMHWVLLAAHMPTATVSVIDSLSLSSSHKYISKWR